MNRMIEEMRANLTMMWLRLVQALNWIALSAAGSVVAIDAMYHNEVSKALDSLPPLVKLGALGAWALLVHYGLRRAAKHV